MKLPLRVAVTTALTSLLFACGAPAGGETSADPVPASDVRTDAAGRTTSDGPAVVSSSKATPETPPPPEVCEKVCVEHCNGSQYCYQECYESCTGSGGGGVGGGGHLPI